MTFKCYNSNNELIAEFLCYPSYDDSVFVIRFDSQEHQYNSINVILQAAYYAVGEELKDKRDMQFSYWMNADSMTVSFNRQFS